MLLRDARLPPPRASSAAAAAGATERAAPGPLPSAELPGCLMLLLQLGPLSDDLLLLL